MYSWLYSVSDPPIRNEEYYSDKETQIIVIFEYQPETALEAVAGLLGLGCYTVTMWVVELVSSVYTTAIEKSTKACYPESQCCGSASGSVGSVCFWPPGSASAKIIRKTLISTVL
jgi:hypothetical protein